MQSNLALIGIVLAVFAAPVTAQVYRCKGQSGVVMQQMPCTDQGEKLDVRPASGKAAQPTQTESLALPANSAAGTRAKSRTETYVDAMQGERIRREGWIEMNDKKAYLERLITQCGIDQRHIGSKRAYSRNNLAGATRDVSITNEMKAAASLCDTKTRSAEREVDQAMAHCEKIKCIAQD